MATIHVDRYDKTWLFWWLNEQKLQSFEEKL